MTTTPRTKSTTPRKPSGARLNRGDKARVLFETGGVSPTGQAGRYTVRGSGMGQRYRVEVNPAGWIYCSCVDWARQYDRDGCNPHETACKHSGAVSLYRKAIKASWRAA